MQSWPAPPTGNGKTSKFPIHGKSLLTTETPRHRDTGTQSRKKGSFGYGIHLPCSFYFELSSLCLCSSNLVLVLSGTVLVLGFPDRSPENKPVDR